VEDTLGAGEEVSVGVELDAGVDATVLDTELAVPAEAAFEWDLGLTCSAGGVAIARSAGIDAIGAEVLAADVVGER
jgi:hypothetical protein